MTKDFESFYLTSSILRLFIKHLKIVRSLDADWFHHLSYTIFCDLFFIKNLFAAPTASVKEVIERTVSVELHINCLICNN